MLKRSEDFSYIKAAVNITKGYWVLVSLFWAAFILIDQYEWYSRDGFVNWIADGNYIMLFFVIAPLAPIPLTHYLILKPLKLRKAWVTKNGIFQ